MNPFFFFFLAVMKFLSSLRIGEMLKQQIMVIPNHTGRHMRVHSPPCPGLQCMRPLLTVQLEENLLKVSVSQFPRLYNGISTRTYLLGGGAAREM